jgi:PST family polysaccharide transporter
MSFKKGFFRSISNLAKYTYLQQGVEFFSTIILSRLLVPEEYGFVAIIHIFSSFIQLFANSGVRQALIRSDYGYTFHRYLFSLAIWIGIILTLGLSLLAYPITLLFEDRALLFPTMVMSLRFTVDSINYVPAAILSKKLNFSKIGQAKFSATIFSVGLSIILAFLGFSYWSLVIPMVIAPLIQYVVLFRHTRIGIKFYGIRAARFAFLKIKALMSNLIAHNTINYWSRNVDKLIIGKFFTQADLGLYNRAFRFVQLTFRLVIGIFNAVLFPSLKKLQESGGNVNKEYNDIMGIITLINFPLVAILIAFPEELVLLLWGQNWLDVSFYLPFVGLLIIFQTLMATMTNVFVLYGKERVMTRITFFASLTSVLSIGIGAFFSMQMLVTLYTAANILVVTPIYIYYGFYRSFRFKTEPLLWFWLPKIVLSTGLLYFIVQENQLALYALLLLLFFHLLINQKNSLLSLYQLITRMIREKSLSIGD